MKCGLTDSCLPVTTASSEETASGAEIDRDDRILVTLQHQLRLRILGVPELYATVLASRDDPSPVRRDGDGEDIILYVIK